MIPAIRSAVSTIDPMLAVANIQTMDQRVSKASALRRFQTSLFTVFAGVALFLAAIGLYGLMAYLVKQRTHEIGVRMALGAQPGNFLRMVIREGMLLAGAGVAIGTGGALGAGRLLQSLLFEIKPTDPATFVVVATVLLIVALAACWIPARRAMSVDPMVALRHE